MMLSNDYYDCVYVYAYWREKYVVIKPPQFKFRLIHVFNKDWDSTLPKILY